MILANIYIFEITLTLAFRWKKSGFEGQEGNKGDL